MALVDDSSVSEVFPFDALLVLDGERGQALDEGSTSTRPVTSAWIRTSNLTMPEQNKPVFKPVHVNNISVDFAAAKLEKIQWCDLIEFLLYSLTNIISKMVEISKEKKSHSYQKNSLSIFLFQPFRSISDIS